VQKRYRRSIGFELGHAPRARREVAFELRVHVRRKVLLDKIRQESHEVVAASLVVHGQVSVQGSRVPDQGNPFRYPNPKPGKPETEA
jgi:hypothetical protein